MNKTKKISAGYARLKRENKLLQHTIEELEQEIKENNHFKKLYFNLLEEKQK